MPVIKLGRLKRVAALLVGALVATLCTAETYYADVIYLAELNQPPLHLKVLYRVPLTSTRNPSSRVGYLWKGQTVEVISLSESQYCVKARVATGPTQGWVSANALEAPPQELVARLRERRAKAEAHRVLIERHEVALGMTRAEVRASLGKPDRISRTRGSQGTEEQWRYARYRYEPHYKREYDAQGQVRQVVSYQREPAGQRIIKFRNDEVVEVADGQAEPSSAPPEPAGPAVP
jgi:hypothetical protein